MVWNEGGLPSGEVEPAGREPGVGLALPGQAKKLNKGELLLEFAWFPVSVRNKLAIKIYATVQDLEDARREGKMIASRGT